MRFFFAFLIVIFGLFIWLGIPYFLMRYEAKKQGVEKISEVHRDRENIHVLDWLFLMGVAFITIVPMLAKWIITGVKPQ